MNTDKLRHATESDLALVDDEHPWPGLASFREQDEHYFKGRGTDIEILRSLVNRERLTVLFGVSGLGKSSLLQAGLFPRLRLENTLPVLIRFDFSDSAANLREQVFAAILRQVQENCIEAPVRDDNETLWEYFHRKDSEFWDARNRITVPLLCFDQFEEVFTLGREDQKRGSDLKQFIRELADLVEGRCPESVKARLDANPDEAKNFSFSRHPYKIIFSLREDYLADLEGLRGLMPSVIHNRMRLEQMNGDQALAVADQTQGRLMETKIAETVVRLVAGEKADQPRELSALRIEPALLSLVCRELNEQRIEIRASQIDAQSVASNREQILENFYERSLHDQSPELRQFIENKLITVSGFRNSEAYDNALGIPGITAEALDNLVQCRLLRLEERDGVKRIELIHDVLTGVVRKNRDQRLLLEKQRQAELDREQAERREQAAQQALRISNRRVLAFLILAGFAIVSSAWGWWSWYDAKEARSKAQHALAVSDFREATQNYQDSNIPYKLAYLAYAVRLDSVLVSSHSLLMNILQQKSPFLPLRIFNHKASIRFASFSSDDMRLLTYSERQVQLWDTETGNKLKGEAIGHKMAITFAQFSPDDTRVVTASEDYTARLWDAQTGKALGEPMRHQASVWSAQFSPDGTRVVTASTDKTARLWDAKTGKALGEPMMHQAKVWSAQFSPDGSLVVTASGDNTAQLWDAQTGKALGKPMRHQAEVNSAQFSPDGTRVVTASVDNTARLWDAKTGKLLGKEMRHKKAVWSIQFSPDGLRVVTASKDKSARLWDGNTGEPLGEAMRHKQSVRSAQFSPDGTRVVTASEDHTARLWDAKIGKPLTEEIRHGAEVWSARFNRKGTWVVTASEDHTARLLNAKIGKPVGVVMRHQEAVRSAQFNRDGKLVVTASEDKTARLWDAQTGKSSGIVMNHDEAISSAEFSPDSTRVVTASEDKTARLWDATGKLVGVISQKATVCSAQFSPDSTRVVTASWDKKAQLWDVKKCAKTCKKLGEPLRHQGAVRSAQFSREREGKQVVTASWDNTARLWDGQSGKPLGNEMNHEAAVLSAEFSPDGTRVVTASDDKTARLWDATGKPLGIMSHKAAVSSAHFSPDGTRIVTASEDYTAVLWDIKKCAKTCKKLGEPLRHQGAVRSAQFSPDGAHVLTASEDKTARLWDAQTGKPLGIVMIHQAGVSSAQFSPDGKWVLTASEDHTARLWNISPIISDNEHLLVELAEALAGNRLSELGAIEPLEDQIERLNNLRRQTENAPLGEPTAESFIRWFLSDPWTRTVSPLSKLTVPDYIRQQIAAGRREQMEQEFPGHPLLRPAEASKQPSTPPPGVKTR